MTRKPMTRKPMTRKRKHAVTRMELVRKSLAIFPTGTNEQIADWCGLSCLDVNAAFVATVREMETRRNIIHLLKRYQKNSDEQIAEWSIYGATFEYVAKVRAEIEGVAERKTEAAKNDARKRQSEKMAWVRSLIEIKPGLSNEQIASWGSHEDDFTFNADFVAYVRLKTQEIAAKEEQPAAKAKAMIVHGDINDVVAAMPELMKVFYNQ